MSSRVVALSNQSEPQVLTVDGNIQLQTYDQWSIVTLLNATLTLPQNPQQGEVHTVLGGVGFNVSGGAAFPLTVDPLFVPPNVTASFIFGNNAWVSNQGAAFTAGTGTFGDGSDGAAVMDGVATFNAFSSLAGTTYTLTRDAYLSNLTVNAGVTLKPAGFRLFVSGLLTNNGTIQRDGNAGALGVAGAALAAQTLGASTAGGAGGTNGIGSDGSNETQCLPGGTGAGGAGGAGGANAGGNAGTYTAFTAAQGSVRSLPWAVELTVNNAGTLIRLNGGAGGGGGGSDNGGVVGGGGGGGGGVVMIAAFALLNSSTGLISTKGGAGAAATGAGGNGGSGGGGGGGDLVLVTRSRVNSGTFSVAGGVASLTVIGTGVAGSNGANGNLVLLST